MHTNKQLQRRKFLKQAGIGLPFLASLHKSESQPFELSPYSYGKVENLDDAFNEAGELAIRIAVASSSPQQIVTFEGELSVKNADIVRTKPYGLEKEEDSFDSPKNKWRLQASQRSSDVLVVWLANSSDKSELSIKTNEVRIDVSIAELLSQPEFRFDENETVILINMLSYREIGEVDPKKVGIKEEGNNFSFVLMADPQGGTHTAPKVDSPTRMKIHNAFIEESIRRVNELNPQPAFTIVNGDFVDSKGQKENFEEMINYYKELNNPLLLELGNHETAYSAKFTPGYYMEDFNNYFAAQKAINGLEKLLYSFNLGKFHFVIWPDPLRDNFWETHPHYFDWLEKDLKKYKDRPTIFIQHVPIHPIGINPLINYVEGVEFKRTMLEILARYGNVKYVFSGHVHIPLKASVKTACSYKGMKLINLPPTGYRPRAFGEQDYEGGPSQGIAIVKIEEDKVQLKFQNVIGKTMTYPDSFPEFNPEHYPLWLAHPWELPATNSLQNGNFEKGLALWHKRFVYQEDDEPSNICEVRRYIRPKSYQCLYLFARTRGYMAPGQDRLPQSINRICQAIKIQSSDDLILSFNYRIEPKHFSPNEWAGAYVWVEGYTHSHKKLNLLYSVGKAFRDPGGKRSKSYQAWYNYFQLPTKPGHIQHAKLSLKLDTEKSEKKWEDLQLDRLVIHLGVWVQNDLSTQQIGIAFDDLRLESRSKASPTESQVDGQSILPTPKEDIYNKRIDHICGEHVQIERT